MKYIKSCLILITALSVSSCSKSDAKAKTNEKTKDTIHLQDDYLVIDRENGEIKLVKNPMHDIKHIEDRLDTMNKMLSCPNFRKKLKDRKNGEVY